MVANQSTLKWLYLFPVAFVSGFVTAVLILPLGLGVDELIIWPLAHLAAALVASFTTTRVASLLDGGRSRGRMLPVIGWAALASLLASAAVLLLQLSPVGEFLPRVMFLGLGIVVVAIAVCLATQNTKLRSEP